MKDDYAPCLSRLLVHEGGYTNHPADPGGPTNFGITITDYRKYVKPGATAADVKAMKVAEAERIYRAKYWNALACDDLPAGVDDCVFDYGVNSGIARSGKVLRRVLGLPDNDWRTSDAVLAALAKRDARAVINAICDERLRFLRALKTWAVFGRGWTSRVVEVRAFALQLATRAAPVAPAPSPPIAPPGKGVVPQHAATKFVTRHGGKIAGVGGAAGGAGAWQWVTSHPLDVAAMAVAGVVLVGATTCAIDRHHQSQQQAATPGLVPVPIAA